MVPSDLLIFSLLEPKSELIIIEDEEEEDDLQKNISDVLEIGGTSTTDHFISHCESPLRKEKHTSYREVTEVRFSVIFVHFAAFLYS